MICQNNILLALNVQKLLNRHSKGKKFTFLHIQVDVRMKMRTQGMDAYSRHKMFMNNYYLYYKGSSNKFVRDSSNDKNDYDIIKVRFYLFIFLFSPIMF